MSIQENKEIVRRFVEEVQNKHKLETIDDLLSPHFVDYSGMTNPPTREATKTFFAALFTAFPDAHFEIHEQVAEGEKVVTYKTLHATHKGPFMGMPASDQKVAVETIDIFTVREGKLTAHWAVADFLSMLRQTGAISAPLEAE
jgi:steroid delta-isomerase-like uncharacterized protein